MGSRRGCCWCWLLTGLMTMAGALAYAELAAMLPNVGGQYVFLREGFSRSADSSTAGPSSR